MERKIIQGFTVGEGGKIGAICNDGTIWTLWAGQWEKLPEIPQDENDLF